MSMYNNVHSCIKAFCLVLGFILYLRLLNCLIYDFCLILRKRFKYLQTVLFCIN